MNIADVLRDYAGQVEAATWKRDWSTAIRLSEEALRLVASSTLKDLLRQGIDVQIPRNRTLALYLGYSEKLGRIKVGVTSSPERRIREINASLRHLAFAQDFEIIHYGFAPEQLTRNSERLMLSRLSQYSAGGEWFIENDEVFETIFEECEYLEGRYRTFLEEFSIEPDLRAVAPASAVTLYPTSEREQWEHLRRLTQLILEWTKLQSEIRKVLEKRLRHWRTLPQQCPLLDGQS